MASRVQKHRTGKRRSPRKRGRPLQSEEQGITDHIVTVARDLFLQDGYKGVSMKRIGEQSRVSPGTLYARFPNKVELFTAVVERQVAIWETETPAHLEKPRESVYDVLLAGILGVMEAGSRLDVAGFVRLLTAEARKFPELAEIYHDHAMQVGFDVLHEAILRTPEGMDMGPAQAKELALTTIEAVNGWLERNHLLNNLDVTRAEKTRVAKRMARIITYGYKQSA